MGAACNLERVGINIAPGQFGVSYYTKGKHVPLPISSYVFLCHCIDLHNLFIRFIFIPATMSLKCSAFRCRRTYKSDSWRLKHIRAHHPEIQIRSTFVPRPPSPYEVSRTKAPGSHPPPQLRACRRILRLGVNSMPIRTLSKMPRYFHISNTLRTLRSPFLMPVNCPCCSYRRRHTPMLASAPFAQGPPDDRPPMPG